jgi:hypothetical protein
MILGAAEFPLGDRPDRVRIVVHNRTRFDADHSVYFTSDRVAAGELTEHVDKRDPRRLRELSSTLQATSGGDREKQPEVAITIDPGAQSSHLPRLLRLFPSTAEVPPPSPPRPKAVWAPADAARGGGECAVASRARADNRQQEDALKRAAERDAR